MTLGDRARTILRATLGYPSIGEQTAREGPFGKARDIVRYFYYHLVFLAVFFLPSWDNFLTRANFSPLWPIAWAKYTSFPTVVTIVGFAFLTGALLGAFFYWHRIGRFLAFVGILQFHALESSFGQPSHQWYPWLYLSFLFLFLPDAWGELDRSVEKRKKFLLIFWGAQALFLLTYSMSGIGKLWSAIVQLAHGQPNAFSPNAFALQIADWLTQMQATTLLGSFIIAHPLVGWPFYLAMLYLLLFAVLAAFRPAIQKLWAFGLILFHIGTYLTMRIYFFPPVILLLLLFFDSPFRSPGTTWRDILANLPFVGWAIERLVRRKTPSAPRRPAFGEARPQAAEIPFHTEER